MSKRTAVGVMLLFASTLTVSSSVAAESNLNLSADQRPVASDLKGRGIARYAVTSNGSQTLLNNAQRFAIYLPSPINERIGITDEESAAEADVELWLSTAPDANGDVMFYARCQLKGGLEVNVTPGGISHVSYKLAIRQSGDRVTGDVCTEDMNVDPGDLPPIDSIMPIVADGDLAWGYVIVSGEPVPALKGTFE
jgi:hypothetical protein